MEAFSSKRRGRGGSGRGGRGRGGGSHDSQQPHDSQTSSPQQQHHDEGGGVASATAPDTSIVNSSSNYKGTGPQRSVEGWILFVTGIHQEAQEDDLLDTFSDFGKVKSVNVNLDRRTGFVKGYALIEFEEYTDAQDAINALHGKEILGKTVCVDWAFVKPAGHGGHGHEHRRRGHGHEHRRRGVPSHSSSSSLFRRR